MPATIDQVDDVDQAPAPARRELVRALRQIRYLEKHLALVVAELREEGATWSEIGDLAGLTAEGARRRWKLPA